MHNSETVFIMAVLRSGIDDIHLVSVSDENMGVVLDKSAGFQSHMRRENLTFKGSGYQGDLGAQK